MTSIMNGKTTFLTLAVGDGLGLTVGFVDGLEVGAAVEGPCVGALFKLAVVGCRK